MDLDKLRKDLERAHPGGAYNIDVRQLKELLTMAEAKVDPWRMFREQPVTQEQHAHIHERLTALEEAIPPPAVVPEQTRVDAGEQAKLDAMTMMSRLAKACTKNHMQPSWEDALTMAIEAVTPDDAQELELLRKLASHCRYWREETVPPAVHSTVCGVLDELAALRKEPA